MKHLYISCLLLALTQPAFATAPATINGDTVSEVEQIIDQDAWMPITTGSFIYDLNGVSPVLPSQPQPQPSFKSKLTKWGGRGDVTLRVINGLLDVAWKIYNWKINR